MFCAQTSYIDPLMFHLAIEQNERTRAVSGAEKTAFAWCLPASALGFLRFVVALVFVSAHMVVPVVCSCLLCRLRCCF